jgi:hypothetical protein
VTSARPPRDGASARTCSSEKAARAQHRSPTAAPQPASPRRAASPRAASSRAAEGSGVRRPRPGRAKALVRPPCPRGSNRPILSATYVTFTARGGARSTLASALLVLVVRAPRPVHFADRTAPFSVLRQTHRRQRRSPCRPDPREQGECSKVQAAQQRPRRGREPARRRVAGQGGGRYKHAIAGAPVSAPQFSCASLFAPSDGPFVRWWPLQRESSPAVAQRSPCPRRAY